MGMLRAEPMTSDPRMAPVVMFALLGKPVAQPNQLPQLRLDGQEQRSVDLG
jgi:hypothetical protein